MIATLHLVCAPLSFHLPQDLWSKRGLVQERVLGEGDGCIPLCTNYITTDPHIQIAPSLPSFLPRTIASREQWCLNPFLLCCFPPMDPAAVGFRSILRITAAHCVCCYCIVARIATPSPAPFLLLFWKERTGRTNSRHSRSI